MASTTEVTESSRAAFEREAADMLDLANTLERDGDQESAADLRDSLAGLLRFMSRARDELT